MVEACAGEEKALAESHPTARTMRRAPICLGMYFNALAMPELEEFGERTRRLGDPLKETLSTALIGAGTWQCGVGKVRMGIAAMRGGTVS